MNDFKKNNRFGGGGDRRGGDFGKRDFGGRPSFGGNRGGFGGGNKFGGGRELELHSATCASCGKNCEVPFKPNGKKPVYCKECFAANGGPAASTPRDNNFAPRENSFAPRRDFAPAPAYKNEAPKADGAGLTEIKRQMDSLNTKIDKIMSMLGGEKIVTTKPVEKVAPPVASTMAPEVDKKPVKPATKKVAAKKKK